MMVSIMMVIMMIIIMMISITISTKNQKVTKALVAGGGLAGGEDKYGDSATNLARSQIWSNRDDYGKIRQVWRHCNKSRHHF